MKKKTPPWKKKEEPKKQSKLEAEVEKFNPSFVKWLKTRRPPKKEKD